MARKLTTPEPDVTGIVTPIRPIGASADGKRNGYYHFCEEMSQNRPFASCVRIIENPTDPTVMIYGADCLKAIRRCPAVNMRQEEREAGKAIYFRERKLQQTSEDTAPAADFITVVQMETESEPAPRSMLDDIELAPAPSYADVLNKVIADQPPIDAPKPVVQPVPIAPMPGETPLQAAIRISKGAKP